MLAERRLEAEEKKFAAGMSTSFEVFQAQRDLAQARSNELRAVLDYNKSQVDFETVQIAPTGGDLHRSGSEHHDAWRRSNRRDGRSGQRHVDDANPTAVGFPEAPATVAGALPGQSRPGNAPVPEDCNPRLRTRLPFC